MITFVCVLRSGGDYDERYVAAMYKGLSECCSYPFRFTCLTDIGNHAKITPLKNKFPGWWSKIEAFRVKGPVIYLDLDTVLVGTIDLLVEHVLCWQEHSTFWMLEAFAKKETYASGIMAWTGDWSFIYDRFCQDSEWTMQGYSWDQRWIRDQVAEIKPINRDLYGIVSYKHHCLSSIPEEAKIICFHGKPRPHEVGGKFFQ